jgi:hypothetical protein
MQTTPLSEIDKEFYRYCCLDSAVTYEINDFLTPRIKGTARTQYEFNVNMLLPLRYMELRGIRYDIEGARNRRNILRVKMFETQARFNALTGFGFTWTSKVEIQQRAEEICLTKDKTRCRKSHIETYERYRDLISLKTPSLATIGELEDLCEVSLNEGSSDQITNYLYNELKLPVQLSEKDKETGKQSPTANYEACLNLSKWCQKNDLKVEYEIIQLIITLRALDTRQRMLAISADRDKRIRCGYNIVGSETGRITCYTSPTGSGYNLQTIPKYTNPDEAPGGVIGDRDLFLADADHYIFECDLEGADSWTVAAYCAMLGDSTMLQDLQVGIRPAKRITLKLRGVQIDYHNIEAVLEASKAVSKSSWDYFACKRVVHGASYLEGARTIGRNILKDSEGKMFMDDRECNMLKDLLLIECYPGIKRYHQYIGRRLSERPFLTAASGQIRQFFGRPDEILTKAVAFEPQANTTYATNKAMWRLWTDRENRIITTNGTNAQQTTRLRVECLHQVHDALVGQFHRSDTNWAIGKIKSWFTNEIKIAGITMVIPFEGGYGSSWGNLKVGEIK